MCDEQPGLQPAAKPLAYRYENAGTFSSETQQIFCVNINDGITPSRGAADQSPTLTHHRGGDGDRPYKHKEVYPCSRLMLTPQNAARGLREISPAISPYQRHSDILHGTTREEAQLDKKLR